MPQQRCKVFQPRCGFTLVELLVVIGTIAVLIGILLPALGLARRSAQKVACAANMHQLGIGIQMYCDQNKGAIPAKGPDGSEMSSNSFAPQAQGGPAAPNSVIGVDDPSIWFNAIPQMIGTKSYYQMLLDDQARTSPAPTSDIHSIFVCPSQIDPGTLSPGSGGDTISSDGKYFLLYGIDSQSKLLPISSPGPGPFFKFNMSYVVNASITNTIANTQSFSTVKLGQCRPADAVVLMVEKLGNPGEYKLPVVQKYVAQPAVASVYASLVNSSGFTSNIAQPKSNWKRFTTRHSGGGNILFADGHVGFFYWPDTQIQPSQFSQISANTYDLNQPSRLVWSIVGPIH